MNMAKNKSMHLEQLERALLPVYGGDLVNRVQVGHWNLVIGGAAPDHVGYHAACVCIVVGTAPELEGGGGVVVLLGWTREDDACIHRSARHRLVCILVLEEDAGGGLHPVVEADVVL